MKKTTRAAVAEIQELIDGKAHVFLGMDWEDLKENGVYDVYTCLIGVTGQYAATTFLGEDNITDECVNAAIELGGRICEALDIFQKEVCGEHQDPA